MTSGAVFGLQMTSETSADTLKYAIAWKSLYPCMWEAKSWSITELDIIVVWTPDLAHCACDVIVSSLHCARHSLEVELLHVRPLQPARLLLAAVLVDAALEVAPLAGRALAARVPLAPPARAAPTHSTLAQLNHLQQCIGLCRVPIKLKKKPSRKSSWKSSQKSNWIFLL